MPSWRPGNHHRRCLALASTWRLRPARVALRVLLDISRTVARARLPAATGIDRVERAYIEWALARERSGFLARTGRLVFLLGSDGPRALLDWFDGRTRPPRMDMFGWLAPQRDPALRRAQALVRRHAVNRVPERGLADMLRGAGWAGAAYLNVGHDNLRPVGLRAIGQAGLTRTVLLHDTIPLDHPEFARAGTVAPFRDKFRAALEADALIANSAHTADRIAAHAEATPPPVTVLPLGIDPAGPVAGTSVESRLASSAESRLASSVEPAQAIAAPEPGPPAFVALGTIEPRKNHLMLLRLWQDLTAELGDAAPHLHIIGRRGWENREVFHLLDTDPVMGRTVHEHGPLDDAAMRALLASARALLFPSLAEGFGLPLGEALDMGVPVIASDLPALRELGGEAPEWCAPADMSSWRKAILSHALPDSPERQAQQARLAQWTAPTWDAHFRGIENLLETNLVQQPVRG